MQCPSTEELNEMTLQVGLVGSDGIVIASDQLITDSWSGSRSLTMGEKFIRGGTIIPCWAGGYPAIDAAKYVATANWDDSEDRLSRLVECGNRAWEDGKYHGRSFPGLHKVLAAFPDGCLFQLEVARQSLVMPVHTAVIQGDVKNTASYLTNHYYPKQTKTTLSNLILLAAHIVLMAGRENPGGVGGLEVAIIPRGGTSYLLPHEQALQLEALSNSIHTSLGEQLRQPFDYRPVTPPSV